MSSIWTIRRSATDAKLTGLCGGVAQHWGVDPVLIRLAAVLLALSGGVGLVLYLAGWLLIPVDGKQDAPIRDVLGEPARRWPREAWVVITAVCCIVAFAALKSVTPFGLGPALVLALVWYFGYYRRRSALPDRSTGALAPPVWPTATEQPAPVQFFRHPGPPTPFTEAAAAWRQRVEEAQQSVSYRGIYDPAPATSAYRSSGAYPAAPGYPAAGAYPATTAFPGAATGSGGPGDRPVSDEDVREPVGPAASLPPAQPLGAESAAYSAFLTLPDPAGLYASPDSAVSAPTRPIRRSASLSARRLRLVALVAVGLTLSGLSLADSYGVDVPIAAYFASCLLVLGLTLVAATWWGRARGILPVALLVLLGTLASTVSGPVAHSQGWATEQVSHTTVESLAPGDSRELGHLEVDLTGLTTTADASYTAHVSTGALDVTTPKDANVVINWRVRSGLMLVNGQEVQAGSDQSGQVVPPSPDRRKKTLTLNLSVDQGLIQVTR